MKEEIIERMASDLGIIRFASETEFSYRCRIVYSGLACWIKTVALDRPVGYRERQVAGVSRRYIYEKCNKVLNSFIEIYPDMKQWFEDCENENAISIIRSRLLRHGDLLNEGFDTNIVLSMIKKQPLTKNIVVRYGDTIREDAVYVGISMISIEKTDKENVAEPSATDWFDKYVSEAWWERGIERISDLEFLDAYKKSKNNYSLWQNKCNANMERITLSRKHINKGGYEYYLIRYSDNLYHRLDPLMVELGETIRIILALRSKARNCICATVVCQEDHVKLCLNCILPIKERTILESYAWPAESINDSLGWIMTNEIWRHFKPYLEALDIQVMEDVNG